MALVDEIRVAVQQASGSNQKIAMFHFQVLKNAKALEGLNAEQFCRELSVPSTYQTEFRKMLSLARLMEAQDAQLTSR